MRSISTITAVGFLFVVLAAPVPAQQLPQSVAPPDKPLKEAAGMGPGLNQAETTPAPQVSSDPGQRAQSSSPIPNKGPAKEVSQQASSMLANPRQGRYGQPARVLDATGRPLNGLIQVAPNRVYDPATDRYHWTVPSGQEQKIVE